MDVRSPQSQDASRNTPQRVELQLSQELPTAAPPTTSGTSNHGDQLRFHQRHGENVELLEGGLVASRKNPYDEFTGATVFTNRPLRLGEVFELTVGVVIDTWSGSVQMGQQ